jgi:hypothetical protein
MSAPFRGSESLPPAVEHEADLVVVGGGMAGVCAAVSAAREGAAVALVQDRPVFGGSASSEVRVPVSGAASSNAWASEGGLVHELMLTERATNPTGPRPTTAHLDLMLDDLLERTEGLEAFRSTVVHGAEVHGDRIVAVTGRQLGSETTVTLRGRHFVDATGDGALAALAGARSRYGRESRAEFGENLAPVEADASSLGSTITMQARRIGSSAPYSAPDWAIDYRGTRLTFDRTMPRVDGDVLSGFWWVEVNDPFHQIRDTQAIRRQLHRHVLGLWDHLKNHSDRREELSDFHLEWIGQIPGKRESRRVVGDVTVTEHEVVDDARWHDEIGAAGWWIDLHVKGGVADLDSPAERENIDRYYRGYARVAPFSVPLRACYAADMANLWLAGRCLSASHVGLGPIRVQQTLAQIGQAVGTAAASALAADVTPRRFANDRASVERLQQRLLRRDVRLLNLPNRDPLDLARGARVVGQSSALSLPEDIAGWQPIGDGRAQVLPELGTGEDRTLSLRLRNPGPAPASVRVNAEPLVQIWDRRPAATVVLGELTLSPGADGWRTVAWPSPSTGCPVRVSVTPARGDAGVVEWASADGAPTGTLSETLIGAPGGPEPDNADLEVFAPDEVRIPRYRLWRQVRRRTQLLRVEPPARPYEAANVVNGWAWPGRGANLWVSDPLRPVVELRWSEPVRVGEVVIAFDTDLDTSTDSRPGLHRAPEAVRDYRVDLRVDGEWVTAAGERGNYLRHRVLRFAPRTATALRVTVLATNGDPSARIYEIRAYPPDREEPDAPSAPRRTG